MANPARAYLATQVETTTQGELLIMLYEAAIKFLRRAKVEIDNKDYAKKGIYISKAMAIIHELAECLNKEKGGEITPKLGSLYQFCTAQLIKANIRLDNKRIDDVINILDGLRSAYAQIIPAHEGKGLQPAAQPATNQQSAPQVPTAPQQPMSYAPQPVQAMQQPTAPKAVPTPPKRATGYAAQAPGQTYQQPVPTPQATPAPPKQDAAMQPKTPPAQETPEKPTLPPKLRSAFNAAKYRAANAYTTNNS